MMRHFCAEKGGKTYVARNNLLHCKSIKKVLQIGVMVQAHSYDLTAIKLKIYYFIFQ
jgi:hypothetical protein